MNYPKHKERKVFVSLKNSILQMEIMSNIIVYFNYSLFIQMEIVGS